MIRDRGSKKWTSLMLPEHVERLKAWKREARIPQRKEPDAQQFEEWNRLVAKAMQDGLPLRMTYWQNGLPSEETVVIHAFDTARQIFRLETAAGDTRTIPLDSVESISET